MRFQAVNTESLLCTQSMPMIGFPLLPAIAQSDKGVPIANLQRLQWLMRREVRTGTRLVRCCQNHAETPMTTLSTVLLAIPHSISHSYLGVRARSEQVSHSAVCAHQGRGAVAVHAPVFSMRWCTRVWGWRAPFPLFTRPSKLSLIPCCVFFVSPAQTPLAWAPSPPCPNPGSG